VIFGESGVCAFRHFRFEPALNIDERDLEVPMDISSSPLTLCSLGTTRVTNYRHSLGTMARLTGGRTRDWCAFTSPARRKLFPKSAALPHYVNELLLVDTHLLSLVGVGCSELPAGSRRGPSQMRGPVGVPSEGPLPSPGPAIHPHRLNEGSQRRRRQSCVNGAQSL
jgi:hypothetical protein